MDYYSVLGVNKDATQDQIKKQYRKLSLEFHPDRPGGNESKFKEINEAYELLSDEKKLEGYHAIIDIAYRLIHLDGSYCNITIPDLNFKPIEPGQNNADMVLEFLDLLDFNSIKNKWIVGQLWFGNELSVGKPFKKNAIK